MDRMIIDDNIPIINVENGEQKNQKNLLDTLKKYQEQKAILSDLILGNESRIERLQEELKKTFLRNETLTIEQDIIRLQVESKRLSDELNAIDNKEKTLDFIIKKNKNFDKTMFLSNVRTLLKERNVKIGQLEADVKVQPGHISRLEKGSNTSDPTVELVVSVAKELDVPIDLLLKTDLSQASNEDWKILMFLNKFYMDTETKEVDWDYIEKERAAKLVAGKPFSKNISISGLKETVFLSNTYKTETIIGGTCFRAHIKGATILLMNVATLAKKYMDDSIVYELWMLTENETKTHFIADSNDDTEKGLITNMLYSLLKEREEEDKAKMDPELENVINSYLMSDE